MIIDPPSFIGHALCAQVDPELFFPEQGESSAVARSICARCPVKAQCLSHAVRNYEPYGVWGGTTPRDRQRLRSDYRRISRTTGGLAS